MEQEKKSKIKIALTSPVEKAVPLYVINSQITRNIEDKIIILSFHSGSPIGPIEEGFQAVLAGTYALPISQVKYIRDELNKFLKEIGEE